MRGGRLREVRAILVKVMWGKEPVPCGAGMYGVLCTILCMYHSIIMAFFFAGDTCNVAMQWYQVDFVLCDITGMAADDHCTTGLYCCPVSSSYRMHQLISFNCM
ncbi:unnamed protein product [Discosporangium mesarthrocarpum]